MKNSAPSLSSLAPQSTLTVQWFLRLLALVYVAAFLSLAFQIEGLVGANGILPVHELLAKLESLGWKKFWYLPTWCWISPTNFTLLFFCYGGTLVGILVTLGYAQGPFFLLLWSFYLALTTAGQIFLGYQWDNLLLETGLIALFLTPWFSRKAIPSWVAIWLVRLVLFKLMFSSGFVKLASGDTTWRHLTALAFHFETQPLPPWSAWYMSQLPFDFFKGLTALTLAMELILPFFIFFHRLRKIAFWGFLAMQTAIALTGNYGFFNVLTMVLCLSLLEDEDWCRTHFKTLSPKAKRRVAEAGDPHRAYEGARWGWPKTGPAMDETGFEIDSRYSETKPKMTAKIKMRLAQVFLVFWLIISFLQFTTLPLKSNFLGRTSRWVLEFCEPFRSINRYGLFAVMTTTRPEIILEGSNNGEFWEEYEFKWKTGSLIRRPAFTGFHMPRLDWQMWFAALGHKKNNLWFNNFVYRLLTGSPDVLKLLEKNPFPDSPPRFLRGHLYEYHFSSWTTRKSLDVWWTRQLIGEYTEVLTLKRDGKE